MSCDALRSHLSSSNSHASWVYLHTPQMLYFKYRMNKAISASKPDVSLFGGHMCLQRKARTGKDFLAFLNNDDSRFARFQLLVLMHESLRKACEGGRSGITRINELKLAHAQITEPVTRLIYHDFNSALKGNLFCSILLCF